MKRVISLILCLCVISSVLSLPVFAETTVSGEIYANGLFFSDEDGITITDVSGVEGVCAEVNICTLSGTVEYAFSILSYCKGVLTGIETFKGTAGEAETHISTPVLTIDPEKAADTTVTAVITTSDFKKILANTGTLGTSKNKIEKIYVNDYEIVVEKGVNEYSLTRYIEKENYPPDIKVFTEDLASEVFVSSVTEGNLTKYTIEVYNASGEVESFTVELTGYVVEPSSVVGVEFNGKALTGFDPQVTEYTYDILADAEIPEIKVYKYNENASVQITPPSGIPGAYLINVENGESVTEYEIYLRAIKEISFSSPTYAYQYTNSSGNVEVGGQSQMLAQRGTENGLAGGSGSVDYTGYAQFKVTLPAGATLTGTSKLTGKVGQPGVYNLYNSSYDTHKVKDSFAEFNDGRATLLATQRIVSGEYNAEKVFEFPSELVRIASNGNVVLALVKGYDSSTKGTKIFFKETVLTLQYVDGLAEHIVSLSDSSFDESVLAKQEKNDEPVVAEITPDVTGEWVNYGDDVLLKISVSAEKPEDMSDEKIFVKLVKPGKTEADEVSAFEKYAYMIPAGENEEGNLDTEFLFSGEAGEYTVVVSCEKSDIYKNTTMYIPGTAKMNSLVHGLENEEFDGTELETFLSESLTELAMDSNLYSKLSNTGRTRAAAYVVEKIDDFTVDGINSMLSEAAAVKGINSSESTDVIEACIAEKCINDIVSINANFADYTGLGNKSELFRMMCLEEIASPGDVAKSLYGNLAAYKIKNITGYGEISAIAENYQEYIEDEAYNLYSALTSDQRIQANKYITSNRSSIKSAADISAVFENAAKEALMPSDNNQSIPQYGGGSGGGSGGGGGGTIGLGSAVTEAPKLEEVKSPFIDVPTDHWGFEAINSLYLKKVIKGKSEDAFCPDDKITRAEFAKLIVEALGLEADETEIKFEDVSSSDWYYQYVIVAYGNGIINGISESVFAPEKNITRQDAAVMILRASDLNGATSDTFTDDSDISDYAKDAVYILKRHDIINGSNGMFKPAANLSRAEAAQLIYKLTEISK